jgi:fructosamine-3-kinase
VKQPSFHLLLSRTDLSELSKEIRKSTSNNFEAVSSSGGAGGGSGATTGVISDGKMQYFYKTTGLYGEGMFRGEFAGLQEMYNTQTIAVPKPICYFTQGYSSFLVMEKLNLGGSGSGPSNILFGRQLAQMHRHVSSNGMFGFHCNNTIGATHQPNDFTSTWPEFWVRCRLNHMLDLVEGQGYSFHDKKQLRQKRYFCDRRNFFSLFCPFALFPF